MPSRTQPKLLDLPTLQALAAEGGYAGSFTLSDESAITALSACLWIDNLDIWQGEGDELTTEEIDEIQELTANLQYELMTHVSGGGDMIKIAEAVAIEDVASLMLDDFDAGTYHTYKLIIQGMKTDYAGNWVDGILIQLNEDPATMHYDDMAIWENASNYIRYEHLTVNAGFEFSWVATTTLTEQAGNGHCELTFFDPQGDDFKHVLGFGMSGGTNTGHMPFTKLSGTYNGEGEITSIEIFPANGTTFKVDPDTAANPSELRMTLYGLT